MQKLWEGERRWEITVQKIKMLEIMVCENGKERASGEEKRKTEMDITWKAISTLNKGVCENGAMLREIKEKLEEMERKDYAEKEEIWKEFELWNTEWERERREAGEKEDREKLSRFNEKRNEEMGRNKLEKLEENLRRLWYSMKKQEEEMEDLKMEARRAVIEFKNELKKVKKEKEEREECNRKECRADAIKVGRGLIDLLKNRMFDEKEESKRKSSGHGRSKLAIKWPQMESVKAEVKKNNLCIKEAGEE